MQGDCIAVVFNFLLKPLVRRVNLRMRILIAKFWRS